MTNEYLYGTNDVVPITEEVADYRIAMLQVHRDKLLEVKREHREYHRLNDVVKAISFWEKLKQGKTI